MTTFADINNFDWATMVEERKAEFPQANDGENVWFDKFLDGQSQVLPVDSTSTTNTVASPLEFSSLFDREGETESLFSSNVTSLDNSPMIKSEETPCATIPNLDITAPQMDFTNNSRTHSTTSMVSMSSLDSEDGSPAADTNSMTKKPKKKRAPRKRLTAHQKQAHNKIEKRYRININAKIAGLQQIIPWVASEKTAFETGEGKPTEEGSAARLNKSMILEKAMSYILHLQEEEKSMKDQLEKLKSEVQRLGGDASAL